MLGTSGVAELQQEDLWVRRNLTRVPGLNPEVFFIFHADDILVPKGQLPPTRCIVEDGWALAGALERFQVSATAASVVIRLADRSQTACKVRRAPQ